MLRRTALVVRPTENGGRCADTCSGAIFLAAQYRAIVSRQAIKRSRAIPGRQAVTWQKECRDIPVYVRKSWQGSRDLAAGAAVRAAVFCCATLAHPRRTERHSDTGFATKTRPRCAWAEARPPVAPAHHAQLCSTARTRLGRGSLGQLRGAGQTAASPAVSAGEGLDGLAGLAARGPAGRGCRATKNKLRRRRMGVISPPRFFSSLFSSQGKDAMRARIFPSYALPGATASRSP